ncbi:aminotransferase class I/II-fold pyridoxal phosphate-dependent enzyme [Desulfosporosinus nitroreducens]|uniref:aminotransferase class I/II-fold pyridoxal phosphate-dependent enzyme n=1 Tax=Desulfosporosinus nitroreducens TaxID=2018668 RepID=UPI00207C24E7|nr:aminotransferase class I/II-fold pyridoxal phosphate-dependent enzyme [Desulfosporosinus nitroreducens]MCO1600573.1 aminotransferase class I/II-fold pyridoxal phosphate-dependent enzyme [Desulfosporosinus nitroreducens]
MQIPSIRLESLGASVFTEMDNLKRELEKAGHNLINLSIGSPDRAPALEIRNVLSQAVLDDNQYGYTLTRGTEEFRKVCAEWYQERFGVILNPETEVLPLMGSQDGLAHIFLAYIDPGDLAFIPDPGYPIYTAGLMLAGGEKVAIPLLEENGYLPDLKQIDPDLARKAKLMFLNYPNNPTAAVASLSFFEKVVDFAKEYDLLICHDAAYSELAFEGFRPVSFLQARGAKEVGIEFHSVSKTYNLAGARLGFAVGNVDVIGTLSQLKSNIDYGVFAPVLSAGAYALNNGQESIEENQSAYQRRRDLLIEGCALAGWKMPMPQGSMFVWAPVPTEQDSVSFAMDLAREAGVIVVPGVAFGEHGEGFVRVALVQDEKVLQEAVERIQHFLKKD